MIRKTIINREREKSFSYGSVCHFRRNEMDFNKIVHIGESEPRFSFINCRWNGYLIYIIYVLKKIFQRIDWWNGYILPLFNLGMRFFLVLIYTASTAARFLDQKQVNPMSELRWFYLVSTLGSGVLRCILHYTCDL